MNYFDRKNESLTPFIEYDGFVLYNIDNINKTSGLDIYLDNVKTIDEAEKLIQRALTTIFDIMEINKIFVNVIRDNYILYEMLHRLNFVLEAIHRRQYYNGQYHDVVYMTVIKDEWKLGGVEYMFNYTDYNIKNR